MPRLHGRSNGWWQALVNAIARAGRSVGCMPIHFADSLQLRIQRTRRGQGKFVTGR
jgi:hypothetical protein